MKKILCVLLTTIFIFIFSIPAFASSSVLNENEKELYKFISNGVLVDGKEYSPLSQYENELLNYLSRSYVDLTKEQTDEAISAISDIYKYTSSDSSLFDGEFSVNMLLSSANRKVIKDAVKAVNACELVLSYELDSGTVVITDKFGKDVYRNGNIIKVTGRKFDFTPLICTFGGIAVLSSVIIFRKKFLHNYEKVK